MSTRTSSGTPYWSANDTACAKQSAKPEIVDPSFAIRSKISPGVPSWNIPTVTYPLWRPSIRNLCVTASRSGGSFLRTGPLLCGAGAIAGAASVFRLPVFSGCVLLLPSRYTDTAFRPSRHASRYVSRISSGVVSSGTLTVLLDGAGDEGLHRRHHPQVAVVADRALAVLRRQRAVEDRQVLVLELGCALDGAVLVHVGHDGRHRGCCVAQALQGHRHCLVHDPHRAAAHQVLLLD